MNNRKYLPTLSELIDRLSIIQLKEVFITEHKKEYAKEMKQILYDIDSIIKNRRVVCADESCSTQSIDIVEGEPITLDAETVRAIIVLAQMNLHIWHNESNCREGHEGGNLQLTHGLNGIRNTAKNKIQETVGGRKDYKTDCLAAEFEDWEISW